MKKSGIFFSFIPLLFVFLNYATSQSPNQYPDKLVFESLSDMDDSRVGMGHCTDGNYIYLGPGYGYRIQHDNILLFDPANDSWMVLASGLLPTHFNSVELIGQRLYIFDGVHGTLENGELAYEMNYSIEIYDLNEGKLIMGPGNPFPSRYAGSATWEKNLYKFGGSSSYNEATGKGTYTNQLIVYETDTKRWFMLAPMPEAKETEGVVIDGVLYTIGGFNGQASDRIDAYDILTDTWEQVGALPTPVSAHSLAVHGNNIWVVGNADDPSFLGYFDTQSNIFKKIDSNLKGRKHGGAVVLKDKLYVFGGKGKSDELDAFHKSIQVANLKE